MKRVLNVVKKGEELKISWPSKHPKSASIKKWLNSLSPGYVEYLLQTGEDPHCSNCQDFECMNNGSGDDACSAFKIGNDW